jgi:hypothetical protein
MLERRTHVVVDRPEQLLQAHTRRSFLKVLGVGGSIVLLPAVFTACDDGGAIITEPIVDAVVLNLSTDTGIMNFLFMNEQIEAAFYNTAVGSVAFTGMTLEQREVLADIRAVENIHREFFRAMLGANRIGNVRLDQETIDAAVATPDSILRTSEMLEDNGVATQNGTAKYIQSADLLAIAGKIVSVEARHVAAVRDLREAAGISAGTPAGTRFAGDDIVVPNGAYAGLDAKIEPATGLSRLLATGFTSADATIGTAPPTKSGTPDSAPPSPTP